MDLKDDKQTCDDNQSFLCPSLRDQWYTVYVILEGFFLML